ncbi:GntR family transcriptional regulator of arabinose operon [Caldicoprobacter guelmensis]|uniref:GntR family transcriptional regulator n=1 Tax=Caldicoprobacter guelmensis TaxID=1170224 RepID=UPI001FAF63A6|nr:GntR family transcriptional regulator [Caldicoprobacter guelmensis]MBM7582931.1 GntR family transcriptional regulator of arabinose operon [Caldicoprobacter guelmensis]
MFEGNEKPKYQRLKKYIIETIQHKQLKFGDRIFSENELAKKFNISRHTVRQAIGELVNEGWVYRVHGKGTFVGNGPCGREEKTHTIGVITTYLNDYIFPSIVRGIDSVLLAQGYNMLLSCTYNQHQMERLCLENLRNHPIAGLIVEPTKSALPNPNLDLYQELRQKNIPILFIHGCYNDFDCSYVVEDDIWAGYIATKHLIELGHTKIGGIFKKDDIQGHYRFAGFKKALEETGLEVVSSRVLWFDTEDAIDFESCMLQPLMHLLQGCSGIVCYNDQVAIKVIDVLRGMNLSVPEDISLVSFDDSQLAVASEVKLTTVAHPQEELGQQAATALLDMIQGKQKRINIKMRPELVIRGSAKKISEREEI